MNSFPLELIAIQADAEDYQQDYQRLSLKLLGNILQVRLRFSAQPALGGPKNRGAKCVLMCIEFIEEGVRIESVLGRRCGWCNGRLAHA